jgi:hypothetical protein
MSNDARATFIRLTRALLDDRLKVDQRPELDQPLTRRGWPPADPSNNRRRPMGR